MPGDKFTGKPVNFIERIAELESERDGLKSRAKGLEEDCKCYEAMKIGVAKRIQSLESRVKELEGERDEARKEAYNFANDIERLRDALEAIAKITNGPSTETWTREGILGLAKGALKAVGVEVSE
jgi:chromosome segregation ATPase